MNRGLQNRGRWWVAMLVAALVWREGMAQMRLPPPQEPQLLTFHLTEASAGVYSEGTFEQDTFEKGGTSASHQHFFIGPALGLTADGSVYHPNFLRYQFNGEGAAGWGLDDVNGTTKVDRKEQQYLGWFSGSASLLPTKPLHGGVFGGYGHTYQNYDFFNLIIVDGWRYGATLVGEEGPWLLNANYSHSDEHMDSLTGPADTAEDVANVTAQNSRSTGTTTLTYTWDQFQRSEPGVNTEGNSQTVSLGDSETFGSRSQYHLNAGASFSKLEAVPQSSEEIVAEAGLTGEHDYHLSSSYNFGYDRFTSGSYQAANYAGQAQVSHQLYQSLSSALIFRGADFESSDQNNSGYTRRYGVGLSENYTKAMGRDSRLRLSTTTFLDHTAQQTIGVAENERHTVGEGGVGPDSFFLNFPNVIELTIRLTDSSKTVIYSPVVDYSVSEQGSRTLITRLIGSRIPPGGTVLANYRTVPTTAGTYDSLSEAFELRFELWKNLLGIFTRVALSRNDAPADLQVQNVSDYAFGADLTWKWFHGGGEYEIYDSDETTYTAVRLFQSFGFNPDEASTLNANFSEAWLHYTETDRQEEYYRFTTRYHRALTQHLALDADAGVAERRGPGVNQYLATVRPSIKYVIGQFSIDASYDYAYELFVNSETRQRQTFFVRLKRVF